MGHGAAPRSRAQAAARRGRPSTARAPKEAHGRLLEEARRLARVRHTHVVQVYGAEQHDGRVGLWMELVRGESLEQTVQTRGAFGAREAALIGLDLCAALAAVHGAGLLHRDVKAQNVMRESGGRLVLMDFGTGEELVGHQSARRHAALPGAGDLPRPARVGAERSVQPRRAAVLPGHRQVPGQRRLDGAAGPGARAPRAPAAARSASRPARSVHRHRRARARQRPERGAIRASASSSRRCASPSMRRRPVRSLPVAGAARRRQLRTRVHGRRRRARRAHRRR